MADFRLGRLKFNWRSAWSGNASYVIDDIVNYGGNTYVCVVNHTSTSGTPGFYTDLNSNYWNLHVPGYSYQGLWTPSTFYRVNDLVRFGASLYTTTTAHTSTGTFDLSKFTLFIGGLEFENSWNSSTTYGAGDLVTFGGYTYVALQAGSNQNPASSPAFWSPFTTGFTAAGVWSGSATYNPGAVVQYGGYTYVANQPTTNVTPTSNQTAWSLLQTGLSWRGDWSAVSDYKLGEVVYSNSNSYINIQEYTVASVGAKDPAVASGYWSVLALGNAAANISLSQVKSAAQTYSIVFGS